MVADGGGWRWVAAWRRPGTLRPPAPSPSPSSGQTRRHLVSTGQRGTLGAASAFSTLGREQQETNFQGKNHHWTGLPEKHLFSGFGLLSALQESEACAKDRQPGRTRHVCVTGESGGGRRRVPQRPVQVLPGRQPRDRDQCGGRRSRPERALYLKETQTDGVRWKNRINMFHNDLPVLTKH